MKTERELFEDFCFKSGLVTNKNFFKNNGCDDEVSAAWGAWQASAQREGFVLVPVCRFCSGHGEVGCRFEGTHPYPECNGSRIDPRLSVEATK